MGEQKQYKVKMHDVTNDREVEVETTAGNTYAAYIEAESTYKKEHGLEWSATMYWLMVEPVFDEEIDPSDYEATYDLDDNQLRVSVLSKVPKAHWMAFKEDLGMQWAPRQRLFKGAWSRSRVELMQHWGIEIEIGACFDDPDARADRFGTYATNAERRSNQAYQRSHDLTSGIPMGQPILVGHHSEKRHRATLAKAHAAMDKTVKESRRSKYWEDRAASVILAHKKRNTVGAVYRRLLGVQKELRKALKNLEGAKTQYARDDYQMVVDVLELREEYLSGVYEALSEEKGVDLASNKDRVQVGMTVMYLGHEAKVLRKHQKTAKIQWRGQGAKFNVEYERLVLPKEVVDAEGEAGADRDGVEAGSVA